METCFSIRATFYVVQSDSPWWQLALYTGAVQAAAAATTAKATITATTATTAHISSFLLDSFMTALRCLMSGVLLALRYWAESKRTYSRACAA